MMDDKPNTPAPGMPRRRWFQFRLRTRLSMVALLAISCDYVAHEAKIVRERAEVLEWVQKRESPEPIGIPGLACRIILADWTVAIDDSRLTWFQRLLGDHFVQWVSCNSNVAPFELNRVKAAFPEASVWPYGDGALTQH